MAKKTVKGKDLAAGFFSQRSAEETTEEVVQEEIKATEAEDREEPLTDETKETDSRSDEDTPQKNVGGRPKKDGLKNEQFTLTMNPEIYEKLRVVAEENTGGNFSRLIDDAIKAYCRENNIDLSRITVDPQILEFYKEKQKKKSKRKNK